MNFFGHAVAATWVDTTPSFGFGAMLPDLASMLGQRPPGAGLTAVSDGIAYHHATDRVFHRGQHFVELQQQARQLLARGGLTKGPRLAIAHIGVELILDAILARNRDHVEAYSRGLEIGLDVRELHWQNKPASERDLTERLHEICKSLLAHRDRLAPRNPRELVERLGRVLSRRPQLRLDVPSRPAVEAWAETAYCEVERVEAAWIAAIRNQVVAEHAARGKSFP